MRVRSLWRGSRAGGIRALLHCINLDARSRTRHVPLLGLGLFQRDDLRSDQAVSWGLLASNALSRSRSWRSHTQRTPADETVSPRFLSSLATRTRPKAGCSIAGVTTASSISDLLWHAVLQHRLLAADFLQGQFAALVVEFFESVEAVAAANHCVTRRGSPPWSMARRKAAAYSRSIAN